MAQENLELVSKIRRIFVQHRIDTSKINFTITNGAARLTGYVVRDDGAEVQPATMSVVDQKLDAIHGLRRIAYEFENLIHNGDSWMHIGRARTEKDNDRTNDMLISMRIRQILVSFRFEVGQVSVGVTNGLARLHGRIVQENGEDPPSHILQAMDDRIRMIPGLERRSYSFDNVFHSGEAWIPIQRRRRERPSPPTRADA